MTKPAPYAMEGTAGVQRFQKVFSRRLLTLPFTAYRLKGPLTS